jgi:hypothetical protein
MKNDTSGSKNEYDKFRKEISFLPDNAFDGHSCFKELTPQQRLDWLAELVVFVYEAGQIRSSQIR